MWPCAGPPGLRSSTTRRLAALPTSPTFRVETNGVPLLLSPEAAWGDLDGDGDSDLLVGGLPAKGSRRRAWCCCATITDGSLAVETALPAARGPVVIADFDNDAWPDVLACNPAAPGPTAVWLNDGDLRFHAGALAFTATNVVAAGAVDFDGDGRLDLWTVEGSTNRVSANAQASGHSCCGVSRPVVWWRPSALTLAEIDAGYRPGLGRFRCGWEH